DWSSDVCSSDLAGLITQRSQVQILPPLRKMSQDIAKARTTETWSGPSSFRPVAQRGRSSLGAAGGVLDQARDRDRVAHHDGVRAVDLLRGRARRGRARRRRRPCCDTTHVVGGRRGEYRGHDRRYRQWPALTFPGAPDTRKVTMRRLRPRPAVLAAVTAVSALALAACSSGGTGSGDAADPTGGTSSGDAAQCEPGALPTLTDGVLTVGAGEAYSPWYVGEHDSGEGFESALIY